MNKRYQVFISSTYSDLKEERSKVMKSIMDLDCIPAGMELFPAVDEEQFEFIKKIIDDSDYYILIIGGRYGSMTEGGISYTEMEFDYAMSKNIPVIAFLHKNINNIPAGKVDMDSTAREKLERFREKVKTGRLVKFWDTPENLTAEVIISLTQTIKTRPGIGWIRANVQTTTESLQELNNLRKEVEKLREYKVKSEENSWPSVDIADWNETFGVSLNWNIWEDLEEVELAVINDKYPPLIEKTWEEWFKLIITEIKRDEFFVGSINDIVTRVIRSMGADFMTATPDYDSVLTMSYQYTALGVIKTNRTFSDDLWSLTAKGEKLYAQIMCVKTKKRK